MSRKYRIQLTNKYKKDYKKMAKQGADMTALSKVVRELSVGKRLAWRHKDHALKEEYKGYRECHIKPDWLLIYRIEEDELVLVLVDTGTHAEMFGL